MRNFIVTIDGKSYQVGVEEVGATQTQVATPIVSEIKPAPAPQKVASALTGTKVEAPMPGMIKSYKVAEGTEVKEGDVILVLEAMKMDNDITAPCAGKVSFKAQVGSNVESGDVMATIS